MSLSVNHKYFRRLLLTFSLLVTAPSIAVQPSSYYVGAGLLPYNMFTTTTKKNGKTSAIAEVFYPLQFRGYWQVFETMMFSPRLAYTLLPSETQDGAAETTMMILSFPVTQKFGESQQHDWSAGLSLMRYTLDGKGGSVTLNNGATGSATFARPGRTSTSQIWALELGVGSSSMDNKYHWGIDLLVPGILTEKRSYSLLLSFNVNLSSGGY